MPNPEETLMLQFDAQLLTDKVDFQKWAYLYYRTRILGVTEEKEENLTKQLQEILLRIFETSSSETFMVEMKNCILIYEMIITLGEGLRMVASVKTETVTSHKSKVEQQMFYICNYIALHCTEKLTLEMAAAVAGFSKYHFSKLFKEYTGQSFTQFQDKERLRIAETLLKEPNLSITEISQEAGFNSISTFNRNFLESKKVSPTKFRKMYQI